MIQDNIARILGQIGAVCRRVGRDPSEVVFVGVTKFADTAQIREAIQSGLTHIGENKVQEAMKKFPALEDIDVKVTKHFIGHLQTNKVKHALEIFDLIQSVDNLKLVTVIEEQAAKLGKQADILLQVNTAGEEQKFGAVPSQVLALVGEITKLKHVRLLGLMTMAPFVEDKEIIRKCFKDLRLLRDQISEKFLSVDRVEMKYLSMGMTADYEIALEEGANMVRVGRAIFNEEK